MESNTLLMDLFKPESIIIYGGLLLLLFVIFAECGLFFGFFLPGDSLLFVAGLLCESHLNISIWLLITLLIIAAFAGSVVGYGFGRWAKIYLRNRKENFFYKKKYLEITKTFYRKYGMMAFVMGRFLPIFRTFIPILAGMVHIRISKFLAYNLLGVCMWVIPLVLLGYGLGNVFPNIIDYLEIIVISLILLTSIPVIISWRKNRQLMTKEKV